MNPYYPNQPGSFYQPNQQYPNSQQQYPQQPMGAQAGPFYGQGQQQGPWGAPTQQGYYPNQQPQYYPSSQPQQQAWGNQGQNVPFYPHSGAGSPYAGSNSNWQGAPGVFAPNASGPFNHVQQVFAQPPGLNNFATTFPQQIPTFAALSSPHAGGQPWNLPSVPPPGYPPSAQYYTAPSFSAPYPDTPLQNYTAAPQHAAPVVPSHQNPPPAPASSGSNIPRHTQFQPETASPVVVNPVTEEADSIDEDILESYIDYFNRTIADDLSYAELADEMEAFTQWIKDRCDNDEKKTEQYLSKIIENLYKQNGPQPKRKLCLLIVFVDISKLSMEHLINYIEQEKKLPESEEAQSCFDHIIHDFALNCHKANDIKQLAHHIEEDSIRDRMINAFIDRNNTILQDKSSDELIGLLSEDNVNRQHWINERVKFDEQAKIEAEQQAKGVCMGLIHQWRSKRSEKEDNILQQVTNIKSKKYQDIFARNVIRSSRFIGLQNGEKLKVLEKLPLQSQSLKKYYIEKIKLQGQSNKGPKVPLRWGALLPAMIEEVIKHGANPSQGGLDIEDGIEILTFIKNNLVESSINLYYLNQGMSLELCRKNFNKIAQARSKMNQENKSGSEASEMSLRAATIATDNTWDQGDNYEILERDQQKYNDAKKLVYSYNQMLSLLEDQNKLIEANSQEERDQKDDNAKKISALKGFGITLTEPEQREFNQHRIL